jgi:hypothetical protein
MSDIWRSWSINPDGLGLVLGLSLDDLRIVLLYSSSTQLSLTGQPCFSRLFRRGGADPHGKDTGVVGPYSSLGPIDG